MKVLWITSAYPSDIHPGSGVFHETQVQALRKEGVDVTVICPVPKNPSVLGVLKKQYRANQEIPAFYRRNGVAVHRPAYTALPGQLRWAQPDKRIADAVLQVVEAEQLEPDVIHAHFAMPSGGAARVIAEKMGLPWLLTLHGSDVNVYPHYSGNAMRAFKQSVLAADQVLAVGENLADKTEEMTGRSSSVLPIGVDLTRFAAPLGTKQGVRKTLKLPLDKKLVVFVGRLTKAKGVFELAAALESLSEDSAIVFVGDGPAKNKLKQHPEYNSRLFLAGQVENERVKDYLFASDAFALPSYTEGMPTVVIEALALKVPVICTNVGGVPDLFGKHRNLLIEPKSVSSLAERIKGVLDQNLFNPDIQQKLYKRVQEKYSAQRNAGQLKEAYLNVVKSARLPV
ncbi:glycosyltransferase family 4 protein [Mesobacillus foraminis]|uniref:teichuronic acid biosynthesis protein TuaC n=1 Tax=Mesobacillus foraminis TaxID=279826 RepID=UPI0039A20320